MASLSNVKQLQQDNRPAYTNWFNSLRRNKQKNPATPIETPAVPVSNTQIPQPLQRSCIDLRNSVFYVKDLDTDLAGTSSTTNIYVDEEHMRRRAGTISKLCSPCCGAKKSLTNTTESEKYPTTPKKYETLEELPDLLPSKEPASVDNNQYETERTGGPNVKDNVVTLVSKRADFLRTTTVTTTHTLVITRPVEVLVNNKGQIIAKSHCTHNFNGKHYLNRRTNSLDCMLDEQGVTSVVGETTVAIRPGVLASCDDLQYIDENNSTSNNNYCHNNNKLNNNNNNNKNNSNFHAYNERCQFVSQVEPIIDMNGRSPKETTSKELQNPHKNSILNNEKNHIVVDSAVVMNNYKKVG